MILIEIYVLYLNWNGAEYNYKVDALRQVAAVEFNANYSVSKVMAVT